MTEGESDEGGRIVINKNVEHSKHLGNGEYKHIEYIFDISE